MDNTARVGLNSIFMASVLMEMQTMERFHKAIGKSGALGRGSLLFNRFAP
jgi:hypothetical protein